MNEKRDAYVQKLKAQLDEWNTDINKLEAKVDQAEVGAKIEYHKRIADLRARIKEVENIITDKKPSRISPRGFDKISPISRAIIQHQHIPY